MIINQCLAVIFVYPYSEKSLKYREEEAEKIIRDQ